MNGSRTTRLGVAVAAAAFGVTLIGVAPASAASSDAKCVSKAEYAKVNSGMTKKHVQKVFDSKGVQTFEATTPSGTYYESRKYKPCTNRQVGFVHIDYKNNQLGEKTVYWG